MTDEDALTVLGAIAGMLGCEEPFYATPREVYQRARRIVDEHEMMRTQLERLVDELDDARELVRTVRRVP